MLVHDKARRVEIPYEPGEWAEIRPLSWGQRRSAMDAFRTESIHKFTEVAPLMEGGMGELLEEARRVRDEQEEAVKAAKEAVGEDPGLEPEDDPLAAMDMGVVLRSGLMGWSYNGGVFDPELIQHLDVQTAEFLAREIAKISVRSYAEGEGSRPRSRDTAAA